MKGRPRHERRSDWRAQKRQAQAAGAAVVELLRAKRQQELSQDAVRTAQPLLSLAMIVKNEECNLARCLESVCGLASELVIVDTGSTDRTREIAEAFGAKVLEYPWQDDFSAARNFGLDHVSGQWTLTLDADDLIEPQSRRTILHEIRNAPADVVGFVMRIHNVRGGKLDVEHPILHLKFWRTDAALRFVGPLHESIPRTSITGRLFRSKARVIHFGYDEQATGPQFQASKRARNRRILEKDIASPSPFPMSAYFLAELDMEDGLFRQAIDRLDGFLRSMSEDPSSYSHRKAEYCYNLRTSAFFALGDWPTFSQLAIEGMRLYPESASSAYLCGIAYAHAQQWEDARVCFLAVAEANARPFSEDDLLPPHKIALGNDQYSPLFLLGLSAWNTKRLTEARQWFEQAVANGGHPGAQRMLEWHDRLSLTPQRGRLTTAERVRSGLT